MDQTATSAGQAVPAFAPASATRRALPPVGVYLRAILALGLGSLRRGFPAVVFLYFYRLGMSLYLAFSADASSPLGTVDQETLILSAAMQGVAYIPLLALVYTPFLSLQDSILAGGRRSLFESMRIVLERLVPFVVSIVLQCLLMFGPPTLLFAGALMVLQGVPPGGEDIVRMVAVLAIVPCILWVLLMATFVMFAIPFLILDSRGPVVSIRLSFDLVARHFWGLSGRLTAFFLAAMLLVAVASLPEVILHVASTATGYDAPLFKIARVIWSSAVSALLFPFSVASFTILYRAMVPGPAGAGGPATAAAPPSEADSPPANPFRFE